MPVARSASASQLCRETPVSPAVTPVGEGAGPVLLQAKAHTLDRFSKPSLLNGHNETRRKRTFMSFRLSKKSGKRKEDGGGGDNSGGGGGGGEGGDGGGSDSSSVASVKPKRRHLIRVSSFVRRVASRVQAVGPALPSIPPPPPKPRVTATGGDNKTGGEKTPNSPPQPVHDYLQFDEDKIPAVMGLRNHGNTCFINAVVQCLNHTDVLAEYFVLDAYKQDLRRCNRIGNRKTSTGVRRGEMTEQVAGVLKALWSLRYIPDVSLSLKACVERHEAAYRGNSQHDAAEFLMFLLGKVHDDLNTASKRKYKKIKNSYGRPDEAVAAETLANHLRCNSSFVQDIFQAQFRSSLRCPHCQKESNTFDPFMCVSLPVPHEEAMAIFVTVVYLNQQPKQVCLGMRVVCGGRCGALRAAVAEDCGLCLDSLVLTEVDGAGFHRTFTDDCRMDCLQPGACVHAVELPSPVVGLEPEHAPFVLITWINVQIAEPENIRFGGVYQSQMARDISYDDMQKLLLKEMTTMVTIHTLTTQQQTGLFRMCVCDGSNDGSGTVIGAGVELPLYSECVDHALALCHQQPHHLKLVLRWDRHNKEKWIVDDVDHVEQHSTVEQMRSNPPQPSPTTLADCLKLHSSAEQLSSGDAWHCPTCDRKQQGVKRLMLWSAPQILVLHLKRFRQGSVHGSSSSKLNTFVSFPINNFDISEHVAQRSSYTTFHVPSYKSLVTSNNNNNNNNRISLENTKNSSNNYSIGSTNASPEKVGSAGDGVDGGGEGVVAGDTTISPPPPPPPQQQPPLPTSIHMGGVWSPWRKPKKMLQQALEDKHVYDLYAVCNHHGTDLLGGHYTASCYNVSAGRWYQFDDSRVQPLDVDELVTQDAYLLFYQRRSSGDGGRLNSAKQQQHWSYRIPWDSLPASLHPTIAQQTRTKQEADKNKGEEKLRNSQKKELNSTSLTTTTSNESSPATSRTNDRSTSPDTATAASVVTSSTTASVFSRGRSYGTLPGHGRSLARDSANERENCSDTEAPLAANEDSPVKKRISDVLERRESEPGEEDGEQGGNDTPMDTSRPHSPQRNVVFCDTANTKQEKNKQLTKETTPEVNSTELVNKDCKIRITKINTVLESTKERCNSSGSKTVLISRCQAVDSGINGSNSSCTNSVQSPVEETQKPADSRGDCDDSSTCSTDQTRKPSNSSSSNINKCSKVPVKNNNPSSTPNVVIQPASPAVLAAHRKSVITVILRQRSPSASSQSQAVSRSASSCSNTSRTSRGSVSSVVSRCSISSGVSRGSVSSVVSRSSVSSAVSRCSVNSVVSRASSSISSFSPETLASIITVNGVTLADNEELSAEFASSLAVAAAAPQEEALHADASNGGGCGASIGGGCDILESKQTVSHSGFRMSSRTSHNNKTASYVLINSPASASSPRPNRAKVHANGRNKTGVQGKTSPNGYSSSNGSASCSSGPNSSATNGYSHYNSSVASRNANNSTRTLQDTVPCKSKCKCCISSNERTANYSNGSSGCCACNGGSGNFSNNITLRKSCGNFGNLGNNTAHSNCSNGSNHSNSINESSSQINNVKSNINRHSSSSLDSGSARRSIGQIRPRYGSECLGCSEETRTPTIYAETGLKNGQRLHKEKASASSLSCSSGCCGYGKPEEMCTSGCEQLRHNSAAPVSSSLPESSV